MKIKLDPKVITPLKNADGYRKWKQDITMVVKMHGYGVLLQPWSSSGPSSGAARQPATPTQATTEQAAGPPLNISTQKDKGKRREEEDEGDEDTMTREKWRQLSEKVVTQTYFLVTPIYQSKIYNLTNKDIPTLFATFDALFINNDTMMIVAKRTELDNTKFTLDKTFPNQIIKFDEKIILFRDMGGQITDQDLTFILIKALPQTYKEKLSNTIGTIRLEPPNLTPTYSQVQQHLLNMFDRDSAWNVLPAGSGSGASGSGSGSGDGSGGPDTALPGIGDKDRRKREKHGGGGGNPRKDKGG